MTETLLTLDHRLGLGRLRAAAWLDNQTVLVATQAALWRWEPATGAVTPFAELGAELLTVNRAAGLAAVAVDCPRRELVVLALADGREVRRLPGHDGDIIHCLALSPDGRLLASGGSDRRLRIREMATGAEILTLEHPGGFSSMDGNPDVVAWSPDGARIATADNEKRLSLWDAATGALLFQTRLPDCAGALAFAPDGQQIAAVLKFGGGSISDKLRFLALVDAHTGELLQQPETSGPTYYSEDMHAVAYSPDGRFCAIGTEKRLPRRLENPAVQIFDTATWQPVKQLPDAPELSAFRWRCMMTMAQRIQEFDRLYQEQAPLRYTILQPGYDFEAVDKLCAQLHVTSLPEDYVALYRWKNGQQDLRDEWMNEFEEDAWYESVPLDDSGHFVSIESAIQLVGMWEEIKAEKDAANQPCYWKTGFIPLLEDQAFGLLVVDTRGYFGGQAGQLVYFDYKCSGGYTVVHESIARWLETNIALLERGLFFRAETPAEIQARVRIGNKINGKYTFNNTVPGIYHYLCHPSFASPLLLGYDNPHCMLPILRWAEVAPLAECARRHGQVAFDPRALYLLFYPLSTLTGDDDLDAARQELTQAWAEFGLLPPDKVASLAARVTWVDADIHWQRDETLGWITNANHSYRNPDNGWTAADFVRWNTFLARALRETSTEGSKE